MDGGVVDGGWSEEWMEEWWMVDGVKNRWKSGGWWME